VARFDLLRKTELRIEGIWLKDVNLNEIAVAVADTLGMHRNDVLVTDLHDDIMTIDILKTCIDVYNIVGKKDKLLQNLAKLPGVNITEKTSICSDGMLGWIAFDDGRAREALKRSEKMAEEIRRKISKKVIVFSTGFEVTSGQIRDTNTPTIVDRLEAEGYSVTQGPTLRDDEWHIAANLRQAVHGDGYGLVITTGGVGAEGKDRTIEAVLALDPEAATPYICRYQKGTGRHIKDGVRIAVGKACDTLIVALPGPNDEVRSSLDVLVQGLQSKLDKNMLSEKIAGNLRKGLREKMAHRDKKDGSEQLPQDIC
jgi:molybdenum cofactor synthesis domain-containing protein